MRRPCPFLILILLAPAFLQGCKSGVEVQTLEARPLQTEPLVVYHPKTISQKVEESLKLRQSLYTALELVQLLDDPQVQGTIEEQMKDLLASADEARLMELRIDALPPGERTREAVEVLEQLRKNKESAELALKKDLDRFFIEIHFKYQFSLNDTKVSDASASRILTEADLEQISEACAHTGVIVLGYGCNLGTERQNAQITQARADHVANWLSHEASCPSGAELIRRGMGKDPRISDELVARLAPEEVERLQQESRGVRIYLFRDKKFMKK